MVTGLFERPAVLWGLLAVTLLVLAAIPPTYLQRRVDDATSGLLAGSYVLALTSLVAVPALPLQYLALTGGFRGPESWLTVAAGYLFALLVATSLYAGIIRRRLGAGRTDRRTAIAIAALPAANLLFLLTSPAIFLISVFLGRIT